MVAQKGIPLSKLRLSAGATFEKRRQLWLFIEDIGWRTEYVVRLPKTAHFGPLWWHRVPPAVACYFSVLNMSSQEVSSTFRHDSHLYSQQPVLFANICEWCVFNFWVLIRNSETSSMPRNNFNSFSSGVPSETWTMHTIDESSIFCLCKKSETAEKLAVIQKQCSSLCSVQSPKIRQIFSSA